MNLRQNRWTKTRGGGLIGAALAILAGILLNLIPATREWFRATSYEVPYRYRSTTDAQELVIVYMDDISYEKLGQDPAKPWDRQLHADTINQLARVGVRAIVFDVVFGGAGNPEADASLAAAMKKFGKVIIAADQQVGYVDGAVSASLSLPYEPFYRAAAGSGHCGLVHSADYTVMIFPEPLANAGTNFPPLCVAAAAAIGVPDADPGNRLRYVNYVGEPLAISSESYYRVRELCSPYFYQDELRSWRSLVRRLASGDTPAARALWPRLDQKLRAALGDGVAAKDELQAPFLEELNQALERGLIFESNVLASVALRPDTRALLAQNPKGEDLLRLNRLLLEDAWPAEAGYKRFDRFKDKVVIIGARQSTGMFSAGKDEFRNPYVMLGAGTLSKGRFSPGTEIHATCLQNLLHRSWLNRPTDGMESVIFLLFGAAIGFALILLRPLPALIAAHVVGVAIFLLACFLHAKAHYWFDWMILPVQTAVAGGWSLVFNAIRLYFEKMLEKAEKERALEEQRRLEAEKQKLEAEQKLLEQERKTLRDMLVKHLSPGRAEQIIKNPELLKPGTRRQVISIMFSDIEAYSKLSEKLDLEELAKQLNSYYELTLSCVHETDGTVVKLIGDAIFAIWNAPFEQADHARRACMGAYLLRTKLLAYDASRSGPVMKTRVGLHMGEASVGNIGSSTRFDYTAVGDSVNIAARLEGMNKMVGTGVLATTAMRNAVGDYMIFRPVGLFRFKGVVNFQFVYEVVGLAERAEETRAWRDAFGAAWKLFSERRWDEAEAAFRGVMAIKPEDGPSLYYLDRIAEFRTETLEADWAGHIILHEK